MPKQPPHAQDVAARLLGAAMQPTDEGTDAAYEMIDVLGSPHTFFDSDHVRIATAIERLLQREGESVDQITVSSELQKMGELDTVGGKTYINDLTINAGVTSNAKEYALIVKEAWLKRQIIEKFTTGVKKAYSPETDALEVLEEAQKDVLEIGTGVEGDAETVEDAVQDRVQQHVETTRKRRAGENPITGVRSGWDRIDEYTGGWEGDQFIVVAARPRMGKTAWGVNAALNMADEGHSPAIFSLEMSESQLVDRLIQCYGKVSMQRVRQGYATDQELKDMYMASKKVGDMPIRVVDKPDLSIASFRTKARRLVRQEDVSVIFIDYLQLFQSSGDHNNREQEIAAISRQLKITSKQLEIPIIALAQVNRKPTQRGGGKRPRISDLRESGAIEQDSDMIAFIHRVEEMDLDMHDKLGVDPTGIADFIIAKQRDGPVGTVYLHFIKEYTRFEPMDLGSEFDEFDEFEGSSISGDGSLEGATMPGWTQKVFDMPEDEQVEQQLQEEIQENGDSDMEPDGQLPI